MKKLPLIRAKKMKRMYDKGFSMSEIGLIWKISKAAVSSFFKSNEISVSRKVMIVDKSRKNVDYACRVCCSGLRKIYVNDVEISCPNCGG